MRALGADRAHHALGRRLSLLLGLMLAPVGCADPGPTSRAASLEQPPEEARPSDTCGSASAFVVRESSGITLTGIEGLTPRACGRELPGPGAFVAVDATAFLRWDAALVGAAGSDGRELVMFAYRAGCSGECLMVEGPAEYSRVQFEFPEPGTYWVGVDAPVVGPTTYALRLDPVDEPEE